MLLVGAALCIALVAMLSGSAHAGVVLEERKLPMKFSWVACQPNCRGWVSAVGIVTADSPRDFDEFARGRQLSGATIVLNSSGYVKGHRLWLVNLDRATGKLTLDEKFVDSVDHKPGIDMNGKAWPHGFKGNAVPHGTVFSR